MINRYRDNTQRAQLILTNDIRIASNMKFENYISLSFFVIFSLHPTNRTLRIGILTRNIANNE